MNLEKLLTKQIGFDEGTSRDCYIFSNFVIKIPKPFDGEIEDEIEYSNNYPDSPINQTKQEIYVWNNIKNSKYSKILAKIYKVIYTKDYPIIIMERLYPLPLYLNEITNQDKNILEYAKKNLDNKFVDEAIQYLVSEFNLADIDLLYYPNCGIDSHFNFKICDYGYKRRTL